MVSSADSSKQPQIKCSPRKNRRKSAIFLTEGQRALIGFKGNHPEPGVASGYMR